MIESGFTVDVDQNQYQPEGGREVSAIVTITSADGAAGLEGPGPAAGAEPEGSAEIIIIDCSGSMEYPHTKIAEARAATAAAIDVVRDGARLTATPQDGRENVRLVLAAYESASAGREVTL